MAQFMAMAPGVEVCGAAVLSVVEGMDLARSMALRILKAHGISDPTKESWHAQQAWLDAFKEIAENVGPATLRRIGTMIPQTALWPPTVRTVADALASIDVAYHMNHRGGEIGHYAFQRTGERSGKMVCGNPYPCEFDLGIVEATARKFAPPGVPVFVKHDDLEPCRKNGADSCTYWITW
ncbi:MAG: hypothetical protein QUS33_11775 [Dehalococcoidia bacterium]|nr:hypothetical protein [Dehalococcoidia bacterium]